MADPFAYKRDAKLQARLAAEVLALLKLPGNGECADCGATRTVRFCSITLGVLARLPQLLMNQRLRSRAGL